MSLPHLVTRLTRLTRRLWRAAAPTSAFAPLASTSRAVPLLHAPAQLPSPQRAPFSVSAPAGESRGKRKTRLVRKANLDKKAQLVRQHEQSRPDPVLGYAQGNQELWDKSLLKQILLRREDVWAGKGGAGSEGEGTAASSSSSKEHYTPQLFNFGLTAETAHQLSDLLPPTAALRSTLGDQATSVGSVMVSRFEDATRAEQDKRDTLMRIVDLRNADSKGIEVENTRRIVEAFGRVPGDTASPEVQGASPWRRHFHDSRSLY